MNMSRILSQSKNLDKLITESEVLENVAYEVKDGAICLMVWQSGRLKKIYGTLSAMKDLGKELYEIADIWDGI